MIPIKDREILIAGLGSIGRRHLANLQALGWRCIRLYRTGRSTLPLPLGETSKVSTMSSVSRMSKMSNMSNISSMSDRFDTSDLSDRADVPDLAAFPVDYDLAAALARRPIAVIVTNPTALHVPLALEASRVGSHLLIEKPLSHDLEGVSALQDAVATRGLTALVGFQFRFNPGLRRIKEWIDAGAIGAVVSVQAHWGQYLPDMHPWEDYRVGYAAQPALGGGVLLTLCHPFDYLRWLVGEINEVSAVESRQGSLDLRVDTCVDVNLRFAGGASGHVHLDFLQRPREHRLMIIGTEGTAVWTDADHAARRYRGLSRDWETIPPPVGFDRNRMFLDEMRHFLACLRGEERPLCTLEDGRAALEVALAARRAMTGAPGPDAADAAMLPATGVMT